MKITILDEKGRAMTLGNDEAGEYIAGFLTAQTRSLERADRIRATDAKVFGRQNRWNEVSWQVTRTHANQAAALLFLQQHVDEVPDSGELVIEQTGAVRRLKDTVISQVRCVAHAGVTTVFAYAAQGGSYKN